MIRTIETQIKNILTIYNLANNEDMEHGRKWYNTANKIALYLANKHKITLFQSAGILSALSPGAFWIQNVIDTDNFLVNNKAVVSTYGANVLKAVNILHVTDKQAIFDILKGKYNKHVNKTACFFMNIIEPDNADYVTIDRHAIRINHNTVNNAVIGLTEKRYKDCMSAYQKAAKKLGINAIQLQAITWIAFRRISELSQNMSVRVLSIDSEIRPLFTENTEELPF